MIIDMLNVHFSDKERINILKQYLYKWTEIPLSINYGYDLNEVKSYDEIIGYLLKQTEHYLKECPSCLTKSDKKFINAWKYQGKLYHVIHAEIINSYSCSLPKIQYHGMISHWTDDYTFKGITYKLSKKEEYIILEADTKNHIGFNVNKFHKKYKCERPNTEKEREIIFPMNKECIIKEHHLSIEEFIKLKENS